MSWRSNSCCGSAVSMGWARFRACAHLPGWLFSPGDAPEELEQWIYPGQAGGYSCSCSPAAITRQRSAPLPRTCASSNQHPGTTLRPPHLTEKAQFSECTEGCWASLSCPVKIVVALARNSCWQGWLHFGKAVARLTVAGKSLMNERDWALRSHDIFLWLLPKRKEKNTQKNKPQNQPQHPGDWKYAA